jgi:hypothetical protein
MSKLLVFLLALIQISCATNKKTIEIVKVEISPSYYIKTDSLFDLFEQQSQVVKLIVYKRENDIKKAQVIIKKHSNSLVVSVLSLSGIELLTVKLTGNELERLGGVIGVDLSFFKRVIADILISELPHKLLLNSLPKGLDLILSENTRSIQANKKNIIHIKYSDGIIQYNHKILNYSIDIQTIMVSE